MKAESLLKQIASRIFQTKELLAPDVWVERFIKLTRKQSNNTGGYSLSRTPYFRQLYKDFANPKIKQISLKKSAQIGASQFLSNIAFYYVCNFALPIAIILPSAEMAASFGQRNIHGTLENLEPVQELRTGDVDDEKRNEILFKNCSLKLLGGGSATKLASNPICLALSDEVDKYSPLVGEADPSELIWDRTLSYRTNPFCKVVSTSTPTLEGSSRIHSLFLEGSQSYFYVPCPHCQHKQRLVFEQVRFSHCKEEDDYNLNRVEKETFYECISCQQPIKEEQKFALINAGDWVDHNPAAPDDTRSYQVSALYSLSITWGGIARLFLSSKADRSRLQNFHNSVLGEAWQPQRVSITDKNISDLVKNSPRYSRGTIPLINGRKPQALVLGADTQQLDMYFLVLAIYETGETAVIDYGAVLSWPDFKQVTERQYKISDTEFMGLWAGAIDAAGTRTNEVYDFCLTSNRIHPLFGRSEKHRLFQPIRWSLFEYKGYTLQLAHVHDKIFSDILLNQVLKTQGEVLFLPKDSDPIFLKQLGAVSLVERKDARGNTVFEYAKKGANEYFDCLKYAFAMRFSIGPTLSSRGQPVEEETAKEPAAAAEPETFLLW